MEAVIGLKKKLATLKERPQAEAMKAVAPKKKATPKEGPHAEAMEEAVAFKKLETLKEDPQSEAMKKQALKTAKTDYLVIETTKMSPTS